MTALPLAASFHSYELSGALDAVAVDHLRQRLGGLPAETREVLVDCARVNAVDAVGAACLWLLGMEWQRRFARRLRVANLAPLFVHKLRLHPLAGLLADAEEVFEDPFGGAVVSER